MTEIINVNDLPAALQAAELIETMIAGINATASRVAPCLTWDGEEDAQPEPSDDQIAEARLVLIGAIQRWVEAGTGAVTQQSAGPFAMSVDTTRPRTGWRLWPSEITDLQDICAGDDDGARAFSVDTVGDCTTHADVCSLNLGAAYCSCGADIAGFPLYEVG